MHRHPLGAQVLVLETQALPAADIGRIGGMGVSLVQEKEQAGLLRDGHIGDCKRLVECGCTRPRGEHVTWPRRA
jgi:hypothetical protein